MLARGAFLVAALATACGGASDAARSATVFDPGSAAVNVAPVDLTSGQATALEAPYPLLDAVGGPGRPPSVGVAVLHGEVRFSRPTRWMIRDASVERGHGYILYVSPDAYSFAIYERSDPPAAPWTDIERRYEEDVTAAGAKASGWRVPVATLTNQGRAYTVERKQPLASRSREILLRGSHRVVLVQIVSQDPDLSRLGPELLEVANHLEVL
ncbi:MAG: hypothetical protein M3O36_15980 [Myxococcota bacterium]|nr:hypothetical protein [Myxococcota bacterium]